MITAKVPIISARCTCGNFWGYRQMEIENKIRKLVNDGKIQTEAEREVFLNMTMKTCCLNVISNACFFTSKR